jgi:hypothetical protein
MEEGILTVVVSIAPDPDTLVYAIEETLPQGVTVIGISENGNHDQKEGKVKWGPFFDKMERTLTYTVLFGDEATTSLVFSGIGSFNGSGVETGGTSTFHFTSPPPPPSPPSIDQGELIEVTLDEDGYPLSFVAPVLSATDSDSGELFWEIADFSENGDATLEISGDHPQLTYQPNKDFHGTDKIVIQVKDPDDNTDQITVNLVVRPVNDPPRIQAIESMTLEHGSEASFTAVATDVESPAEHLRWSLIGSVPPGASINFQTGAFQWHPEPDQAPGDYAFVVQVEDDAAPSASSQATFSITLKPAVIANNGSTAYAEYYFDADPGEGLGMPISLPDHDDDVSLEFRAELAGLEPGHHTLFVRTKDRENRWSTVQRIPFFKAAQTTDEPGTSILRIEYALYAPSGLVRSMNIPLNVGNSDLDADYQLLLPEISPSELYRVDIWAVDEAGRTSLIHHLNLEVTIPEEKFSDWLTQQFTSEELEDVTLSELHADPDGDGASNLLEYALGSSPTDEDDVHWPELVQDADGKLSFEFVQPTDRDGVRFSIQKSDSLDVWFLSDTPVLSTSLDGFIIHRASILPEKNMEFFKLQVQPDYSVHVTEW